LIIFELQNKLLKSSEERANNTFDEFFVLILVLKYKVEDLNESLVCAAPQYFFQIEVLQFILKLLASNNHQNMDDSRIVPHLSLTKDCLQQVDDFLWLTINCGFSYPI
jgi:hypothetical protein